VDVSKHLIPGIGAHRLEKLAPEHVERLYARLGRSGLAPGGVHHVHRTLRAALNEAVRRSHLTRNPVLLAKAPKLAEKDVEPYGIEEVQRLLDVASQRRNSARWAIALALGLRRGRRSGCAGRTWI
jgi:integrase